MADERLVGSLDLPPLGGSATLKFRLSKFQAVASGRANSIIGIYLSGGYIQFAVYADSAGYPGQLLGYTDEGGATLLPLPIVGTGPMITAGQYYWLAFANRSASIKIANSGIAGTMKEATISFPYTFPDPCPGGMSSRSYLALIAVYGAMPGCPRQAMHYRRLL